MRYGPMGAFIVRGKRSAGKKLRHFLQPQFAPLLQELPSSLSE